MIKWLYIDSGQICQTLSDRQGIWGVRCTFSSCLLFPWHTRSSSQTATDPQMYCKCQFCASFRNKKEAHFMRFAFIHWFPVLFTYDSNISYWMVHVGWWTTHVTCSLKGPWTKSLSYWLLWIAASQTNHEPQQTKPSLWSECSLRNWGTIGVWGLGKHLVEDLGYRARNRNYTWTEFAKKRGGGVLGEGVGNCHMKQSLEGFILTSIFSGEQKSLTP